MEVLTKEPLQPVEVQGRPLGAIGFVKVVRPTYTLVMTGPDTFSVSPRVFAKLGLSIERLCERAGVAPSNMWVTSDFFRLWATADKELDDRSAGVRFGAEGIARGYGVASIVALHAPDFRHALAALSRYKRLTCPELVEVEIEGAEATVRYRWLQATSEVQRLLVDTTMASLRELARQGTAGQVTPIRLELARRPMDRALLRRLNECKTSFQQQLAGVRRTTASRLLANTELDTVAIAMLLGFVEPNSFARVFRSRERTTLLRWRERKTGSQA